MKCFAILAAALFGLVQAEQRPAFLSVPRGGAALGPLDADLASKLCKTATTAYVAGSASKYINKQSGGEDSLLSKFVTGDLFQLHALITVIAYSMFGLIDTGFDAMDALAGGALLAAGLRIHADGVSTDSVKNNAVQTVIALVLAVIAFVD